MSALDQPSPFEDGHRYQVLTEAEFATLAHPRYIVTELVGFSASRRKRSPGHYFHVIDTAVNHNLVSTYRSDDLGARRKELRLGMAREAAAERCAELNAEHERFMAGLT